MARKSTRTSGPLSDTEVRAIIDNMSDEQRHIYDRLEQWNRTQHTTDLQVAWVIGREISDVDQNTKSYGKRFVATVARLLGHEPGYLYQRKVFFERFPSDDEYNRLISLKLPSGSPLTFTHVVKVLGLQEDERWELLTRAARQGWSSRDLTKEISKKNNADGMGRGVGGRPVSVPVDVDGILASVSDTLPALVKRVRLLVADVTGLVARLGETADESLRSGWPRVLVAQINELDQLMQLVPEWRDHWAKARQQLERRLKKPAARAQAIPVAPSEPVAVGATDDDVVLSRLFSDHRASQ